VREQAAWLARGRWRWCRHGAVPVLCVVRPRGVERVEQGVLVVSIDRLIAVPRSGIGGLDGVAAGAYGMRGRVGQQEGRG
jgi:hypothetical protein